MSMQDSLHSTTRCCYFLQARAPPAETDWDCRVSLGSSSSSSSSSSPFTRALSFPLAPRLLYGGSAHAPAAAAPRPSPLPLPERERERESRPSFPSPRAMHQARARASERASKKEGLNYCDTVYASAWLVPLPAAQACGFPSISMQPRGRVNCSPSLSARGLMDGRRHVRVFVCISMRYFTPSRLSLSLSISRPVHKRTV